MSSKFQVTMFEVSLTEVGWATAQVEEKVPALTADH